MRRQGGGFGFVMLLVVVAVVLYLAVNNFKSVAPAAMDVKRHNEARRAGQTVEAGSAESKPASTSASADTWTPAPPARPNLETMDKKTTDHTNAVGDALSQAN